MPPAPPSRTRSGGPGPDQGFTLLEIAIWMVVAGILLGAGVMAWSSFRDSRRLALTASQLYQIKDCLTRRVLHSERYPSWNSSAAYAFCRYSFLDVDACMCQSGAGTTDSWGRSIYLLAGVDSTPRALGDRVAGLPSQLLLTDSARNQTALFPAAGSTATDHTGVVRPDVAYILFSYGIDGTADHASYGNRFSGAFATYRANVLDTANPPNFQTGHKDDVYLVVTAGELSSALKN